VLMTSPLWAVVAVLPARSSLLAGVGQRSALCVAFAAVVLILVPVDVLVSGYLLAPATGLGWVGLLLSAVGNGLAWRWLRPLRRSFTLVFARPAYQWRDPARAARKARRLLEVRDVLRAQVRSDADQRAATARAQERARQEVIGDRLAAAVDPAAVAEWGRAVSAAYVTAGLDQGWADLYHDIATRPGRSEIVALAARARVFLPSPSVSDAKLQNYVAALYKGTRGSERVGTGTTAEAVIYERVTGEVTQGRRHTIKAEETVNGLRRWLRKNPQAAPSDRIVAQSLLDELINALETEK
jgi:hypothetical protein